MTYEEVITKYRQLFIMLVESAGRETGNKTYLKIEKLLDDNSDLFKRLVDEERDLRIVLGCFVTIIFTDIYGEEELCSWDKDKACEKITEFYTVFLKGPTKKFCEKYGIESFDDPEIAFKIMKIK